jgi:DNA-binding beta-propeller fold protein YncE
MPDRGLAVDNRAYVSLNLLTPDFKSGGPGQVVIVDGATDQVTGTIPLPEVKNCGSLARGAGTSRLAVGCSGVFADGARQADASGVGVIDLAASPPAASVIKASGFGGAVSNLDVALLGPTRGLAVVSGSFQPMRADQLWAFDLAGGMPAKVLDVSGPFALSGLGVDGTGKKVFVGDADPKAPKVLVLDAADPALPVASSFTPTASGLPPRALILY